MKKITLLFWLPLLLLSISAQAQVLIGNGNNQSQNAPFEPYYGYSYVQSIYTASEINATGQITGIRWYFSGSTALTNSQGLVIYLGHTTKTSFADQSDFVAVDDLTQVYSGGIAPTGPGWVTITFDTPFDYNGTDNLVVATDENMGGYDESGDDFYNSDVSSDRTIYAYSDYLNIDPSDPNNNGDEFPSRGVSQYVPNVIFEGIQQTCPTPMDLVASDPTTTGASFTWDPVGNATQFEIFFTTVDNPDPTSSTSGTTVSNNAAYTATTLLPGVNYKAYVRNNCGTEFSNWAGPTYFTTLCVATTDFSENFDTTDLNLTPTCWSSLMQTTATYYGNGVSEYESFSPERSYQLYVDGDTAANAFLISPSVNNIAAATHRLRFKALGYSGSIHVGTMTDPTDASTFTDVQTITPTGDWTSYISEIPASADTFIAFKLGMDTSYSAVYLDDIVWETTPACGDVTVLNVSNVTNNSAQISWEPAETETAWQYVYALATVDSPTGLTPVAVTGDPSATINGLLPNTQYKYWVRSDCGSGNYGAFLDPKTFKTACDASSNFSENFDSYDYGAVPDCWTTLKTDANTFASVYVLDYNGVDDSNSLRIGNSDDATGGIYAITPNLNNIAAGTHRLKFKAETFSEATLVVGTMTDPLDASTFTAFETITPTDEYNSYSVQFPGSTDNYIAFKHGGGETYTTIYLDQVVWEPLPTDVPGCATTTVSLDNCGTRATTITWPAVAGADGYHISIGSATNSYDLVDAEAVETGNFTFTGEAGTTYYYLVVPFNEIGEASGCTEQTFTTSATQCFCLSEPISFDNSGITNFTVGDVSTDVPEISHYDINDAIPVIAGDTTTAAITFGTEYTYNSYIWVDLNNDYSLDTDELLFTGESTDDSPTTLDASFLIPDGTPEGVYNARLATGDSLDTPNPCYNGSYGVTINFKVQVTALGTPGFETNKITFHPNPVNDVLHVAAQQNIDNIEVYNLLGQKIMEANPNNTAADLNMSALSAGSYIVKLTSAQATQTIKVLKK